MEILRKVGRQEEELLERGKLTKSLTTPQAPPPKRKREEPDKRCNIIPNMKKGDWTIKLERDHPDGKPREIPRQEIETILLRRTNILIGKKHKTESKTMWLTNEKRRNAALVAAWTTTPGENAVSQLWLPQPSHTKIGETLNNHLNQELALSQCSKLP